MRISPIKVPKQSFTGFLVRENCNKGVRNINTDYIIYYEPDGEDGIIAHLEGNVSATYKNLTPEQFAQCIIASNEHGAVTVLENKKSQDDNSYKPISTGGYQE